MITIKFETDKLFQSDDMYGILITAINSDLQSTCDCVNSLAGFYNKKLTAKKLKSLMQMIQDQVNSVIKGSHGLGRTVSYDEPIANSIREKYKNELKGKSE